MHSLLTVLPDLYEEDEGIVEAPKEPERPEEPLEPLELVVDNTKVEELEAPAITDSALSKPEPSDDARSAGDGTDAPPPSSQASDVCPNPAEFAATTTLEGAQGDNVRAGPPADSNTPATSSFDDPPGPLPQSSSPPPQSVPELVPELSPETPPESTPEPADAPLPPPLPEAEASLDEKPPRYSTPPRTASPEPVSGPESESEHEAPEPRPRRPRVSLPALLMHADALFERFPPDDPRVALATVLGPQSAMRTWSERPEDLPDDSDAEAMVAHPELVVCPYTGDDDDEGEKEKGEEEMEKERRRRKLRKPRRLTELVLHRRTMVAGAVIVLGVAVAVYGLNAGLPGGGNGHHHRHGFGREWRKVGKFIGGVFMGAGGRIFDGIRRGLE